MLAVGGWGGSKYFSSAVATEANRTAFAKAIMVVVSQYGLDGIEFEYALLALSFHIFIYSSTYSWEHPAKQGIGCNVISTNDSTNFLLFLQTLRAQDCAQDITISAAVSIVPFIGPDGTPMKDVSGFDKVLDYIGSPSPISLSNLTVCLTTSRRDHELRCLGILERRRRTQLAFERFMRGTSKSARICRLGREGLDYRRLPGQ